MQHQASSTDLKNYGLDSVCHSCTVEPWQKAEGTGVKRPWVRNQHRN